MQKAFDKKLNYSQQVFEQLESGALDPSDLPRPGFPGSNKYLSLYPNKNDIGHSIEINQYREDAQNEKNGYLFGSLNQNFEPLEELPEGWARFDQKFQENSDTAHGGAFGADGLPAGESLEELPYSWDLLFSQFDKDMWKKFNPIKWGKCGEERREAINLILQNNIKNFGYTIDKLDKFGKRIFIPNNEQAYEKILDLFEDYKERTASERLVMLPKKDHMALPIKLLRNANRFNDESKKMTMRLRYENLFYDAGRKYNSAVMMTLTNDQKLHNNVFEANKSHQENWNKLITRLRKEAKDERVKELVKKNPEFLKVRIPKNLIAMPGGGEMADYEFSSDILTPHSQKSLPAFLEAAESFQCRTRAARRYEGLQGRDESDSHYFKRIQKREKVHNATAAELRAAAEEYIKSDNSLKFPYICVREYQKNGNVHYHIRLSQNCSELYFWVINTKVYLHLKHIFL